MTSNEAMLLYVFANLKIAFIVVIKILNTIVTSMFTIAVLNYPFGDRIGELTFFLLVGLLSICLLYLVYVEKLATPIFATTNIAVLLCFCLKEWSQMPEDNKKFFRRVFAFTCLVLIVYYFE